MNTKKTSITKAFNGIVFPEMEKDGFIKLSNKLYVRLLDHDIAQFFSIWVRNSIKREFKIEYGVMFISEPHEFLTKTIGGDFKKGTSGGYYGAQNEKALEKSVQRVLIAYHEEILPKLNEVSTLNSLSKKYEELTKDNSDFGGHQAFTLACLYCYTDREAEAIDLLNIAYQKFLDSYNKNNDCDWALDCTEKIKILQEALESSTQSKLFAKWREFSIEKLKLRKLKI